MAAGRGFSRVWGQVGEEAGVVGGWKQAGRKQGTYHRASSGLGTGRRTDRGSPPACCACGGGGVHMGIRWCVSAEDDLTLSLISGLPFCQSSSMRVQRHVFTTSVIQPGSS